MGAAAAIVPRLRLQSFKALPGNFIWTSPAKTKRSSRPRRPSKNPRNRVRVSVEPSDLAAQLKQPGSRCDAIGRDCTGPAGDHFSRSRTCYERIAGVLVASELASAVRRAMSDLKALQVWPVNSTLWRIDLCAHYLDLRAALADFLSELLTALWPRPLDFASADRCAA